MFIVRIRKLGTRTKFGHRLPITIEGSINRTFENRDRSITGSSVELIALNNRDNSSARTKAETNVTVRNQAKITFANFVSYWNYVGTTSAYYSRAYRKTPMINLGIYPDVRKMHRVDILISDIVRVYQIYEILNGTTYT